MSSTRQRERSPWRAVDGPHCLYAYEATLSDSLKVLIQHLLPKRSLTAFAGRVARARGGAMTTRLISWFVRKYGVDMSEAENPDVATYPSFNDFFTRPLKAGARPIADADFVSPVDGAISQFGAIDDHHMLQAKGHVFTTIELVGGDNELAEIPGTQYLIGSR